MRDALWLLLTYPETAEREEPTILSGVVRTHAHLPLQPQHYDAFRDAVVDAVARHDSREPALLEAWRKAMRPGLDYLKTKLVKGADGAATSSG